MTPDQLSQLKLMSPGEIARKYTPMLIRGAIKKEQFDWLISQGLKNTSCEPLGASERGVSGYAQVRLPQRDCARCGRKECQIPFCLQQRLTTETALGKKCVAAKYSNDCHGDCSADTASQFTTHDNESAGRSQKDRLLAMLSDGLWHTTPEIMERVYGSDHLGLSRIPARANDLKNDGYQIESERVQGSVWKYRLNK